MKLLQTFSVLAFSAIALLACNNSNSPKGEEGMVRITGTATDMTKLNVEVLRPRVTEPVDSFVLVGGKMDFSFPSTELTFYLLTFDNGMRLTLVTEPGEVVELNVSESEDGMPEYTVSGSPHSSILKEIVDMNKKYMRRTDTLNAELMSYQDSANFAEKREELIAVYLGMEQEYRKELVAYIEKNTATPAIIYALYQQMGGGPMLSVDGDFLLFEKVSLALTEKYPESEHVKFLQEQINENRAIAVGAMAPEITLPAPNGEPVSLSSLKGKYVLIDFWAAWCKPCRNENPNVVKAYNRFKDKGFEVFGVSLDGVPNQPEPRDAWLKAVQDDQLTWTQVSDLQGWNTSVIADYKFSGIPHSVLIDPTGKILAKNLRGTALHEKLEEIFGK